METKERIEKFIANKTKEEAIDFLEGIIFYEQMADFMDFEFVNTCEEVLKELKNGK